MQYIDVAVPVRSRLMRPYAAKRSSDYTSRRVYRVRLACKLHAY
jgi:hypothetical protein